MRSKHIDAVDSIRGLASLSVVLDHALMTFVAIASTAAQTFHAPTALAWVLAYTPLHLFWAGHEAVILFFVLSGYVLALPYMEYRSQTYGPFALRRVCRIYLPYLATIVLSGTLLTIFRSTGLVSTNIAGTSEWFNGMWHTPITWTTGADMLLMLGRYTHAFDTSTWSLVHEMRISLLFPVIALSVRRFDWKIAAIVAGGLSVANGVLVRVVGTHLPSTVGDTIYFSAFFVAGAILAKYRPVVTAYLAKRSAVALTGFIVLALFLYLWGWEIPAVPPHLATVVRDWAIAAGSAVLIMLASTPGAISRWLTRPWLRSLGRVSYSLYLVHPVVLLVTVYGLQPWMKWQTAVLLVPLFALIASGIMYAFVERPAMQLGYDLSRRLWPRPAITKEPTASVP